MGNAPPSPSRERPQFPSPRSPRGRPTSEAQTAIEGVGVINISSATPELEAKPKVERLTESELLRYATEQRAEADRLEQAKAELLMSSARRDASGRSEEDLEVQRKNAVEEANKAKARYDKLRRDAIERQDERLAILLSAGLDEEELRREQDQAKLMEALVGVVSVLSKSPSADKAVSDRKPK